MPLMHHPSPDHAILRITGPDARSFLQSQLTHDVTALSPGGWQWQGYCSPKGRLYATFALVRDAADAYLAVVHATLIEALARRLTLYRLRAKATIEPATDLAVHLHLAEPEPSPAIRATLALGGGRWITLDASADAHARVASADAGFMQRWRAAGIAAMQPEVTAATSERFVPQTIGWDRVAPGGGVSFNKGCYPGQEVVARAHYRGAVKRALERVELAIDGALPEAGTELTLPDGRTGEICNIAGTSPGRAVALLVVGAKTD